ncbi:rod shape-determining protein RodA [Planktomarina sp.]|nr:rod shape-determining protein RodA [Planktomarina sp.]MDC1249954.1 rod shape-determining protein RodA [Planktomarina sp.]
MSYLEYNLKTVPTGFKKILALSWPIIFLLIVISSIGFAMLYSVSGGVVERWAQPQMQRFFVGMIMLFIVAMVPSWFWRNISFITYILGVSLLLSVEFFGVKGMGAQRWLDFGFARLQPSELMKITLVLVLAAYYDWLPQKRTSQPIWVTIPMIMIALPALLVLRQPDLGTALLLIAGGGAVMFLAGVHWAYFITIISSGLSLAFAVFQSRGTTWQLLKDYQYTRIDTFLDPSRDPLGTGYHITQAKIALGSGGWTGRGFMQGTQSRLNFLPEKHTDFIFTTISEEFGFVGSITLLILYLAVLFFCTLSGFSNKDRFASLLTLGIGSTFFLFFAINMAMVMGLVPVVGVPLPLVSYGGSAMLVLLLGFGLMQSAHVHRPQRK